MKINLFPEKWKLIPNFENYAVSNQGRIMRISKGSSTYAGKILKLWKQTYGYSNIHLSINGNQGYFKIHYLVGLVFLGACPHGKQINHINGNRYDNRIENLEYITPSENIKHAYRIGLKSNAGESHPRAKLSWSKVKKIFELHEFGCLGKEIAEVFNVTQSAISLVLTGKNWKH